ncbi:MAG: hypothetical protein QOJ46_164 [bacterium]|jgi:hypothetical protein
MALSSIPPSQGCAACGHEHLVAFYETEEHLVATVVEYLVPALAYGDSAIVVATAEHREAFAEEISFAGVDLDAATRDGRYQALDAADLLSRFMVGGAPEPRRFREVVERVLAGAAAEEREIRVYGEMVALLWAEGDVMSTIALEDLWNELGAEHGFSLFCGYPVSGFDVQSRSAFEHICGQHNTVRHPPLRATEAGPVEADEQGETAS